MFTLNLPVEKPTQLGKFVKPYASSDFYEIVKLQNALLMAEGVGFEPTARISTGTV